MRNVNGRLNELSFRIRVFAFLIFGPWIFSILFLLSGSEANEKGLDPSLEARINTGELSDREAMFYKREENGYVTCGICPRRCVIPPGSRGACGVRYNRNGTLVSLVFGRPCSANVDPIEKKPLYHVLPGTKIYSVATTGCNLRCKFCQNWEISQALPEAVPSMKLEPADLVREALSSGCSSIAFTYTEPVVFYEYVYETCLLAREKGLRTVMVTALYINEEPAKKLAPFIDAATVDVKSFDKKFYEEMCSGEPGPVLAAIKEFKKAGVFIEMVNLLVPSRNDSDREITGLSEWIVNELGPETPIHFLRFFPRFKVRDLPPTPVSTMERALGLAKKAGLVHVYLGNVLEGQGNSTFCSKCGKLLIERYGYQLVKNELVDGKCPGCGQPLSGIFR